MIQNQIKYLDDLDAIDNEGETADQIRKKAELRKKKIENVNAEYPSHSFVTIVSCVRVGSEEVYSEPQLQTLICSGKAPALLRRVDPFFADEWDEDQFPIAIYFKVKNRYSAILHFISRNFSLFITDPCVHLLPKDQFKLLLKHKYLNVAHEDEVVKAVCLWLEGQDPREGLDKDLGEVLQNVNWNYVSTPCFLDLIRNFHGIRRNRAFRDAVGKEFKQRLKFDPEKADLKVPRFSYKYNRTQNGLEIASKSKKNSKALLYVNHENFFQSLLDAMLDPVDVVRSHLVNEGITESSHKRFLEAQIQQKRKELHDLES